MAERFSGAAGANAFVPAAAIRSGAELRRKTCAVLRLFRAFSRRGCGDGRALFGRGGANAFVPAVAARGAEEPERALSQLRHGRLCGWRPVYTAAYRAISGWPAKPVSSGSRPFRPCPNGMCVSAPDRRLMASGAACRGAGLLQHREHMRGAYRALSARKAPHCGEI